MRRTSALLIVCVFVFSLSPAQLASQSTASMNLVENPGLEEGLAYWSSTGGTAAYTSDSAYRHSGSFSAKGVETQVGNLGRLYQDVTGLCMPGREYKIGGWIKTASVVGFAVIALNYVAATGWSPADGYVKEIGYVTGTNDWTYFESEKFTLPPMPVDCVALWFLFDFNAGRGTAWWDDVFLVEVTTPSSRVLIDEGHSEWFASSNAQELIDALESRGHVVETFSGTITQSVLSAYDVLLIGTAWGSFAQPEIQTIVDFVANGGGLWMTGLGWSWVDYHPGSTISDYPMNEIAQEFGAFFNPDIVFDPTDYTTDPGSAVFHTPFIYNHPVTAGVALVGASGANIGSVSVTTGTLLVAGDEDSYGGYHESPYPSPGAHPPVLAAMDYGLGRVVVVGHEWFFVDDHIDEYDNRILGTNIVDWLAQSTLTHSVPYYSQGSTGWCIPTSMAMIFRYYGKNVHSWNVARDWNLQRQPLFVKAPWEIEQYFEGRGLVAEYAWHDPISPIDFKTIKMWIDHKGPILLGMPSVKHAVVIVGYDVKGKNVYLNDPSGALLEKMNIVADEPYIAVEVEWNQIPLVTLDWAMAVSGNPSPPAGSMNIIDSSAKSYHTRNSLSYVGIYSWLYGLEKGLVWANSQRHPLCLDPSDVLLFESVIINHMEGRQYYKFEVEFAKEGYSETFWSMETSVEGKSMGQPIDAVIRMSDIAFYGQYVVTLRLWSADGTRLYDEVVFPTVSFVQSLSVSLESAADLYVIDPLGRCIGTDPTTGDEVNEIPGAVYSGSGTIPQVVAIPDPFEGSYEVQVVGTYAGDYLLAIEFATTESVTQTYGGEIVEHAVYAYSVFIADEVININPDPRAELEYLKDFIDEIPNSCFSEPEERAVRLKRALSNKIDEVTLKIEYQNYVDSLNKLFFDIRAKMDGDSTAEDWVIDLQAQSDLCTIIDHIISNIEELMQK